MSMNYHDKRKQAWRERTRHNHDMRLNAHKPSAASKPLRSNSDTPMILITNRFRIAIRSRKVKPSMPKMPWDKEPQT